MKVQLLSDRNKILNDEQIDNGITLKSTDNAENSLFPKKNEMDNNVRVCDKVL